MMNARLRRGTTLLLILAMTAPVPPGTGAAQAAVAGPTLDGTPLGTGGWRSGSGQALGRLYDPYAEPQAAPVEMSAASPGASASTPQTDLQPLPPPQATRVPPTPPTKLDPLPPLPPVSTTSAADRQPALDTTLTHDPQEPPAGAVESLREAIVASLKQNPDIQIALAQQDDARYGVHEAWAGYMPHIDMTVAVGGEYNSPALGSSTRLQRSEGVVTLNQNIWDFGTTANDIARARAAYRSAQWSTRERIEAISYDISEAYLSVLERQKLVDLAQDEIAGTEKILKMVTIQEDLGLTTPADVSRAKARLDNVQAELLDRRSALQQAREAYRRLTDHLPGMPVDLPVAAKALPQSAQDAVAMIDDHNPRLAQAVQDRRSIEKQRASQTGTFFPRVSLMAQGNWRDDVQGRTGLNRDARAMVTVTYNFFNGGADIAVRNRLSARLRQADYELDRRRREVEQDIRIDFNALNAAREKISKIDSEIVAAEKTADLYRQQFREGHRSVFDLLDSQQILYDAKARQLTNGTEKTLAEFRVLQQLGGLFDLLSEGQPLPRIVEPAPGATH